jgi:seryl-tRNA synthetase
MLDLTVLRRDPERVRRAAGRRGQAATFVDEVLDIDRELRAALTSVETLKAQKNALTDSISKASDRKSEAERLRPEIAALDAQIAAEAERAPELQTKIDARLSEIPNLVDDSVPDGSDESANVVVRTHGTPRKFSFEPKPHYELGEALDIIDFERAAKLSGSRFSVLRGKGARLARAIVNFFLDRANDAGYLEMSPPYLVTRSTMWSTGQLSKFADAMFSDQEADLFLIPTAEVPLTAFYRDEILAPGVLPQRFAAYTACFRKEAGAAGRDTRGLIRQHQFEKVELVWIVEPDKSFDALEQLTAHSASLLEKLGLPYRMLSLCAGDIGFNAAKTYDLEVWLPAQGTYREISSCSNCTDFQARRSAIRYRQAPKAKPELVHTLNGSGLAVGRTLVAILENYQEADGSIRIPEALRHYVGFDTIEPV